MVVCPRLSVYEGEHMHRYHNETLSSVCIKRVIFPLQGEVTTLSRAPRVRLSGAGGGVATVALHSGMNRVSVATTCFTLKVEKQLEQEETVM